MSDKKKDTVTEKTETFEQAVTFTFLKKTAKKSGGYLAMCGWHGNYVEMEKDGEKIGTVTFINGSLGIHGLDKRKVLHVDLTPLIEAAMEKLEG